MAPCSFCKAIDVSTLPTFTGFNRNTGVRELRALPSQPHHPTFADLKISARTCDLCSVFLAKIDIPPEPLPAGVAVVPWGGQGFVTDIPPISPSEGPIVVRGLGKDGWSKDKRLLYGLQVECGQGITCQFGLYTDPDSTAARSGHVVGRTPKPVGECGQLLQWLQDCMQNHPECSRYEGLFSPDPFFPTRILDLDPAGLSDGMIRLSPGAGLDGQVYAALSHCWGKAPVVRTTKASLPLFTQGVDPSTLSKTFMDAISLTRNLGIRYLWIDSLCIVQDDALDWEREAARMALVYSKARVTIAASAASDGTHGLLRKPADTPFIPLASDDRVLVGPKLQRFQDLARQPLNARAWTLQERILAPRTLHFGHDQVHWECRALLASESGLPPYWDLLSTSSENSFHFGWLPRISAALMPPPTPASPTPAPEEGYSTWYGMLQAYSDRLITNPSDRLPALSGLASAYAKSRPSEYLAGIWLADLVPGLLWHRRGNEVLSRPGDGYRAPSWSWASVEGPVDFVTTTTASYLDRDRGGAEYIAHEIKLRGMDPFGRVAAGSLTLRGRVKGAWIQTVEEEDEWEGVRASTQVLFDEISAVGSVVPDVVPVEDGEVWCLEVARAFGLGVMLVLEELPSTGGEDARGWVFKRVGVAFLFQERDFEPESTLRPGPEGEGKGLVERQEKSWGHSLEGWFEDAELLTVTIV
ncbi:heterokaryon incompatibility protein-domain-containing protein [Podospora conica]|nr:heterokaryon incompatibility protein-domain-containing protein [Schizothecium conicum]